MVTGNALFTAFRALLRKPHPWKQRTLVIGPSEPVDGDSVASTKALINYLRSQGKEAYTLPTLTMYRQLEWILDRSDIHPSCWPLTSPTLTTPDLQAAYDRMVQEWQPDEIVMVDGQLDRLVFDPGPDVSLYVIDHHAAKGSRNDVGAYIQAAPSAGCLLIDHFGIYDPILAVSIITDTLWFKRSMPATSLRHMNILRRKGLTDELLQEYQHKLEVRKDPAVLETLRNCDYRVEGDAVFVVMEDDCADLHRSIVIELASFYTHVCVVRGDGYASFRTEDHAVNLAPLAAKFGIGGGHRNFAATKLHFMDSVILDNLHGEFLETVGVRYVRSGSAV